ncbi:putative glutamine amidotransferase [Endobacter medicaginis]|uniref:Gamma-glutamyl-gamma-aminobutyrate hydrolase family protein n=1 Tax=Endobacter medicaginis TaxID=1181271 RepID=A0A839V2R6_9PROT|nr:gamma-glutamyl-gamma-aminobutyrate hydrolase family protein [Endobacter medicaginis]MBB3174794.1 putative glutamine amidotransferase [Endobacter medicaginis]MCX5475854.1 gamma-glutamyl-gamma-aminobutyrate hydrolase family protein [Endobacter medicaginis]NVN31829.1 gamma-glutamyl-gamma-aminobutyrate hydrolase family protein [Endobacter medicaginis]
MTKSRPLIGVTLDAEPPATEDAPGYSKYPWYALRANYLGALAAAGALPVALPHEPDLAIDFIERLDGLVVTGGAFDVDPALYGDDVWHGKTQVKPLRTTAEFALLKAAIARDIPVLGICGGEQLLAVALGGTLHQHVPDAIEDALEHEGHMPGHPVALVPDTLLADIVGAPTMFVNSSHHQAVRDPGTATVSAFAPDGVIEGIEARGRRFCVGVQWHPEFETDPGDARLLAAFVAACAA